MGGASRFGLAVLTLGVRVLLLAALLSASSAPTPAGSDPLSLSAKPLLAGDCSTANADSSGHERCADPSHHCCLPVGEDADGVAARSAFAAGARSVDAAEPYTRPEHDLPRWRRLQAFSARAPPSFS